eukprot:sb/3477805/
MNSLTNWGPGVILSYPLRLEVSISNRKSESIDGHGECERQKTTNSWVPPVIVASMLRWWQEPTEISKRPIRTRYLGHVTSYQPIRDEYALIIFGRFLVGGTNGDV